MNMQDFLQLLNEDVDLAQKMTGAANPDEAYAIAKEAGLTDSFEVFTDTMTKIYKAQSELSDEEIDAVVGGTDPLKTLTALATVIGSTSMAITAGAAATI